MNIEAQSRALRQLAAQLIRDEAKADDLVQDTWVDALQHPPSGGRPAGPWLRTVLRNRRVSNLRAQARRTRREQARQAPVHPASAEQIQLGRELLEHLAALPEADRDLLTLRYWEALTLNECAGRLGISASTARSRHARALDKLRDRLDTRTGGREAWLSALAPWVVKAPPPAVAAAPPLSLASLSVGGVVAGACLWLVSGLNPGCGTEFETTAPPDAAQEN
ncbi:MAG: RNA polymerase sigma factor, partial [Nannocystaceae bacterium]|nr:RNA polymerase sigma factor [Nannocystaceae bacterium]